MTVALPPELMSAEDRAARIAEIPHEISREWLRFALTESIVLFLPFAVFLVVYVTTDAVPDVALVPVMIAGGWALGGLVVYWLTKRVQPLQRELDALKRYDSGA